MEDDVAFFFRMARVWVVCITALAGLFPVNTFGLAESTGPGGSNAQAVHELGQTGEGVRVGFLAGQNVRATHEAFLDANGISHVFNYDFAGDGILPSSHDTRFAGIISSRGGLSYPDDIGDAPGADVFCARVADNNDIVSTTWLTEAMKELITVQNCSVIVTGFSIPALDPNGDSFWTLLYDYYAYEYDIVFANAAGNSNTRVDVFGDAYNGITTGGLRLNDPNNQYDYRRVGLISGEGPTGDGRRKPDIVASSESQTVPSAGSDTQWETVGSAYGETSYSVPHTAGVAALLLGFAAGTGQADTNQDEVIRAAIVNSTFPNVDDKTGNQTNPADVNNTWHNERGYGRIDAFRVLRVLDSNRIMPDVNTNTDRGWAFGTLGAGQQHTYTINLPAPCRLIATTTWDRRVEWIDEKRGSPPKTNGIIEPGELHPYFANIDMIVYEPNDPNAIFSEELNGLNLRDNLEKCDVLLTEAGDYNVIIVNDSNNGESADYGFAFELHPLLIGDFQPDYVVDYTDMEVLSLEWLGDADYVDAELYPDGIINFLDLAVLADYWLQTDPAYHQMP